MENETPAQRGRGSPNEIGRQNQIGEETIPEPAKKNYVLPASILISAIILAGAWIYTTGLKYQQNQAQVQPQVKNQIAASEIEGKVLPTNGVVLPVRWGDLGAKMIQAGVIDAEKFEALYTSRGGLTNDERQLLSGADKGNLKITSKNSGTILNLLWALGLAAKNDILERGEMADSRYGGAGNFASTGGWTLAKGDSSTGSGQAAMDHYARHPFIVLTPAQQALVERVSKNIYRPCCDNATHFPDCNHGMAMLGLLELMASQGVGENEMYRVALQVNSYWFPDTYLTIAEYLQSKGVAWESANPKELLGYNFSSGSGYRRIVSQITTPPEKKSSGGCGV